MATTSGSKRLLDISANGMAASNSMTYGGLNVATEQYVSTQISNLISSAPGALDTLNELAAALGDDPNFATTITNSIATKLDSSVNPLKAASVSNDTITFTRADNTTFAISTSDANTNYYLNGITRSGNVLTFSVNGTTNRTYTFGSNAFTSTTIPTNTNQLTNGAGFITSVSDDRNTRGVSRLYRRDGGDDYSIQHNWTGSHWHIRGYAGDTFHAEARVGYADTAGSANAVTWANVSGKPTIPTNNNQLTNGAGYITDGNTNWNNSYGFITASSNITGTSGGVNKVVGAGSDANLLYATIASNDFFRLKVGGASNAGFVEIATADDGTEPIYVRQYTGVFSTLQRTAALLDTSGNTSFPGNLTSNNVITNQVFMQSITSDGSIANDKGSYLHIGGWGVSRTHSTAVLVNTAYMADILANNRTFTIGSTGKNFNGSGNVSWTLAEIGAESAGAASSVNDRIDNEVLPAIGAVTLATLGYTGATNANYITNNNQLSNGAGYLTSTNDRVYITDSRGAARAPSYYNDRYAQWDFQNTSDTGAGGDSWHALLTVSKWSSFNAAHRQEQLIFTGDDLKRRTATSDSAWGTVKTIWDSGNLDAFVGATVSNDTITFTKANGGTVAVTTTDANTNTWRGIHDTPVNGATTTSISSNWAFDNVKTAVPANAKFTDTNTTYSVGDGGLTEKNFTTAMLTKLDGIQASANNYSLPAGSSSVRGGFKIGYTENGKNYPVEVSSEKMFVNVPWTDTNTTYTVGDGGLTQKNFTTALKTKLDGISSNADNYGGWHIGNGADTQLISSGNWVNFNGNVSITGTGTESDPYQIDISTVNSWRPVDDTPVNGATTTSISSNWAFDNVKTAVPANAVFTDTNTQLTDAQVRSKFSAGTNVSISAAGVISATDTNTTYSNFGPSTSGLVPGTSGGDGDLFLAGDGTFKFTPDTNTTYTAGAGLDLSGTVFFVESNLAGDVHTIGRDGNDKYVVNTANHAWYLDGALDMLLNNSGTLQVDGDVIAYSTATNSDRRLKKDISTIENASEKVSKLRGVDYTWSHGKLSGKKDIGLIAQEVEEVIPEVVTTGELLDGTEAKNVDYGKLVGLLIESNKEMQNRITELEARLDGLTK